MVKSTKLTLKKRKGGNLKKLVTTPLNLAKSLVSGVTSRVTKIAKNTRSTLKKFTGFGKKKGKKTANRKKTFRKGK